MSEFVGFCELSEEELKTLLQELESSSQPSYYYYFMRSPSHVSGIVETMKDFPTPEGQLFNRNLELRWKKQSSGYSVLLLTTTGELSDFKFQPIERKWKVEERPAYGYGSSETRFPKSLIYADSLDIRPPPTRQKPVIKQKPDQPKDRSKRKLAQLAQRYFIDSNTATVHFIALTLEILQ